MRDDADRSELLARHLLAGMDALRAERFADAVAELEPVASDEELAAADDLRDIRARACTLLAQAHLGAGELEASTPWLDEAERLLGALDDAGGLSEVRALRRQRADLLTDRARKLQAAARLAELARTPLTELRSRASSEAMLQDLLVQKANAEVEAGRPDEGASIAREAVALALRLDTVRGEVLARMSLARAAPDLALEELTAAWRRAERANEFNLVGAVARAASLAGVELPVMVGPQLEPE